MKNRPISTNKGKINEYIELLIQNYNSILEYTKINSESLSADEKTQTFCKIKHCRELLVRCFGKLNCKVKVPKNVNLFVLVSKNVMTDSESDSENFESGSESERKLNIEEKDKLETAMATIEQKKSYVSMCASIIRDNYNGNPLVLDSFLDKIELIEGLTESNLTSTLVSFIKSKLEGKAREALPENISDVSDIKLALKSRIKPDNSKVVAGKIAALHVKNDNYAEFAKEAEDLADALERSLVIEGITKKKAHEMAIEQTVGVCRLNAKSDLVKSILASSVFSDPKEVVAKLVVEQATETKERQVLAFQGNNHDFNCNSCQRNNFNRFRGNNFNRGNFRGSNYHRGNNRGNGNNDRFRNNYRGTNRNDYPRNTNDRELLFGL